MYMYVRACMRACVHAYVRACVRACVRTCVRACVYEQKKKELLTITFRSSMDFIFKQDMYFIISNITS